MLWKFVKIAVLANIMIATKAMRYLVQSNLKDLNNFFMNFYQLKIS